MATSLAYVESKRKRTGLIRRTPVEQLDFLVKVGWPLRSLTVEGRTLFFDPLGLFTTSLTAEPLEGMREAMQRISSFTFSPEELKDKLQRALGLIQEPGVVHETRGLVPTPAARDVSRELIREEEVPSTELEGRISDEEFLKKAREAMSVLDQSKAEVEEIKANLNSLTKLRDSWEDELGEKERGFRKNYEARIEDSKRYLGPDAAPEVQRHLGPDGAPEVQKLKVEMDDEIAKLKETIGGPLNLLKSLIEKFEAARSRRESFVEALEEDAPEGLNLAVPFIVASLSGKEGRRLLVIPPSNMSKVGIGGRLKRAFGAIVVPMKPRSPFYESMRSLLEKELLSNVHFSSHISEVAEKENLVSKYSDSITNGIARLRDMEILDEEDATEVMSLIRAG